MGMKGIKENERACRATGRYGTRRNIWVRSVGLGNVYEGLGLSEIGLVEV